MDVGELLGISQKQAHDYFHNTYVKQFYENIKAYRADLLDILTRMFTLCTLKEGGSKAIINETILQFKAKH